MPVGNREGPNGRRAWGVKFVGRAQKAGFPGGEYCWWSEGGEAAGSKPGGRAVPGMDDQQGLMGRKGLDVCRTAGYGPACPVVWEGGGGSPPPYSTGEA